MLDMVPRDHRSEKAQWWSEPSRPTRRTRIIKPRLPHHPALVLEPPRTSSWAATGKTSPDLQGNLVINTGGVPAADSPLDAYRESLPGGRRAHAEGRQPPGHAQRGRAGESLGSAVVYASATASRSRTLTSSAGQQAGRPISRTERTRRSPWSAPIRCPTWRWSEPERNATAAVLGEAEDLVVGQPVVAVGARSARLPVTRAWSARSAGQC